MDIFKNDQLAKIISRREKMRRNPVPWGILCFISTIVLVALVFPKFSDWNTKKSEISQMELEMSQLETEQKNKKLEHNNLSIEFEEKSKPYLVRESQIFPRKVDAAKVARILELYALQLEMLDTPSRDSHFRLNSVGFSARKKEKNKNYTSVEAKLSFSSDKENLKELIWYLQTGELSDRFDEGKEAGLLDTADFKFLQDNLLPLAHIESISVTEERLSKNPDHLKVQIKVKFFSQLAKI